MSERRHLWFFLAAAALLLAPLAMVAIPAAAESPTFIVDRTDDDAFDSTEAIGFYCKDAVGNDCSLRQAIGEAARDGVASTIVFDVGAPIEITEGTLLIDTPNLTIDALPAPPATGIVVEINGQGASFPAFTITTNAITIKGLSIYGFSGLLSPSGSAIQLKGAPATGNTISNNYIGVQLDGSTTIANVNGIRLTEGASGNTVSGNIIGGSTIAGISIEDSSSNTIQGNAIGIGVGDVSLRNQEAGIVIISSAGTSTGNVIGGATNSLANTISGNGPGSGATKAGILLQGAGTSGNTIRANRIGTNGGVSATAGTTAVPNSGDGIRFENGAHDNVVVSSAAAPVLISGNSGYGIRIRGTGTNNNQIQGGVYIGMNLNRTAALPNLLGGISVDSGAQGTSVAGSGLSALTLIGGNNGAGVTVSDSTTTGTQLGSLYTYIGLAPSTAGPDVTLANTGGGILVKSNAQHTTIRNSTISGNTGFGIRLSSTKTVTITGNYIGLSTARNALVNNSGPGVDVQAGSTGTAVGAPGGGNYIAGNGGDGVRIAGTGTISTTVENNVIGLLNTTANGNNTTYTVAAGNTGSGILVNNNAQRVTINGNRVASHTAAAGISLSDVLTASLSLNNIGYVEGVTPASRPNATGISLTNVTAVDVLSNTVKFNAGDGISATNIQTATLNFNTITDQTAGGDGIQVGGDSSRVQVLSNEITGNSGFGVLVSDTSQRVRIQTNEISKNTLGGVDLAGTTSGLGVPADPASAPNHGIDPPILDPSFTSPLRFRIDQTGLFSGYVFTDTLSACLPLTTCQIQFFQPDPNSPPDGQGYIPYQLTFSGGGTPFDFISPNSEGFFVGRLSLGGSNLPAQLIFAATDADGNSSEFGVLDLNPSLKVNYVSPANGMQDAKPGDTISYTLNLVNDGTLDLRDVNVATAESLNGWAVLPPNGQQNLITLPDHSTLTLTITMTLPSGSHLNVRAGVQDRTRLIAQATGNISPLSPSRIMTTTVLASPVLSAVSLKNSGSAPPTGKVTHTHRFTNSGNITVTLDMSYQTLDPANSGFIWDTVLSASTLEIPPGLSRTVDATITVPLGAQTVTASGQPLVITTIVTGTAQAPFNTLASSASGTTMVDLVPSVQMGGNGQSLQAESFAEVSFNHSVRNTSNGPARFCLKSRSTSGSTVVSYTSQNNVAINAQGCFQLDTTTGPSPILRFKATIKVTGTLLPQDVDNVEIYLTNADTGKEVPNSTVVDSIEITVSPLLPRIWLPAVYR